PGPCDVLVDAPVALDLRDVPDAAQEAVGDAGRAPRAPGDLPRTPGVDLGTEDLRRPLDDRPEVVGVVVVEPCDQPEAVAQRPGDEPGPGRRADEAEPRQVEADGAGRGTLAQHDVELEVLHRRVEHLLDGPGQPVDLVDEEHVALTELREDRGQVAGALQRRTGGDVQRHVHLGGDDHRQRGLAQTWRAGEEEVVGRLLAPPGRFEDDGHAALELRLADELVEGARSQRGDRVERLLPAGRGGRWRLELEAVVVRRPPQQLVAWHGAPQAAPRRWSASRSRSEESPSSGRSARTRELSSLP